MTNDKLTRHDIDQLCELLSRLDRSQWLKVYATVDRAFDSSRQQFLEQHRDEWERHGKTPDWFSERLAVLLED